MSDVFDGYSAPDVPEEVFRDIEGEFRTYLFFENVSRGVRKYTCTACHGVFERGAAVLLRTETEDDRATASAKHLTEARCPLCGTVSQVRNARYSRALCYEAKFKAIFVPLTHDEVWVRCFGVVKRYRDVIDPAAERTEYFTYRLTPGTAIQWRRGWTGAERVKVWHDPFIWNHGYYTEKYDYDTVWASGEIGSIDGTFLKYCAFDRYDGVRAFNVPLMKYLCWYCLHPQIEMLAKLGHDSLMTEMLERNTDCPRRIEWTAQSPAALYRLDGQEYRGFAERCFDTDLLRAYRALGARLAWDDAESLSRVCQCSRGRVRSFAAAAKRWGVRVRDALRYVRRVHGKEAPSDRCAKWERYSSLARSLGLIGKIEAFPPKLSAALARLEFQKGEAEIRDRARAARSEAARAERALREKFPKVGEICESLRGAYAYTDGKYEIVVPDGIADIVAEGIVLGHCTDARRVERYLERITEGESFIMFLRKAEARDVPWYTLEVEPGAHVRQKRTLNDTQGGDLADAEAFLRKWQSAISGHLSAEEIRRAEISRIKRLAEFAKLRADGVTVRYGDFAGQLLADILEGDLMENENIKGEKICRT